MKKNIAVSPERAVAKKASGEQKAYLTKRILVSAAKRGFKQAAKEAMQLMGYVVIAKDGWVVKKYADGTIEKISPIEQINTRNVIPRD